MLSDDQAEAFAESERQRRRSDPGLHARRLIGRLEAIPRAVERAKLSVYGDWGWSHHTGGPGEEWDEWADVIQGARRALDQLEADLRAGRAKRPTKVPGARQPSLRMVKRPATIHDTKMTRIPRK